jgi:sulfur carrier protein
MNDTIPSRLVVNGETVDCKARTLDRLLAELGYGGAKVATALNGEFVPEKARSATALADGDAVEIVAPRQGG